MNPKFFKQPVLNSPYKAPGRHWQLDASGQPTHEIVASRRSADFVTPVPKPRRAGRGVATGSEQSMMVLDEGRGLSTADQQYLKDVINRVREHVTRWRTVPDPNRWHVTPRLLPGRRRSLQGPEDDPQGRDRCRSVGHVEERHVPRLRPSQVGSHRRQGDQPPGRRSHEGLSGVSARQADQVELTRDRVLEVLRAHKTELTRRYRVEALALFGSFGRGQATEKSDVDILVRFAAPATPRWFFETQAYLEGLLGRRVDPVTDKALRPEFRPYVEAEAVRV